MIRGLSGLLEVNLRVFGRVLRERVRIGLIVSRTSIK